MKSTAQNLRFLEAQLDQYLHSHEVGAGTLYTTQRGFRLPFRKSVLNLERNMRFIERQLEEHLHDHEASAGGSLVTVDSDIWNSGDPDFDAFQGFFTAGGGVLNAAQGITPTAGTVISTISARVGRVEGTNGSIILEIVEGSDPSAAATTTSAGVALSTLNDISDISDGTSLNASFPMTEFTFASPYTSDGSHIIVRASTTGSSVGDWRANQDAGYAGGTGYTKTAVGGWSASSFLDFELSIGGPATLTIKPVGFRFPYDWKKQGAIKDNMKFLETQLTQYMHNHEVA